MAKHIYTVIGAGAIGGTLAAHMSAAGLAVQVIDADAQHINAIRRTGLEIRGPEQTLVAEVPAFCLDNAPDRLDRVLLAVKSQATDKAAAWIAPRLAPTGYVASMQNGLNGATLASYVGTERVILAFVDLFADVLEPGVIRDGGRGGLALGEYSGQASDRVRQLAQDLHHWGSPVVTDNIAGFLWSKLGFGAMLSATALEDADMAALIDRHRPAMSGLAAEVFDVAAAEGIRLEKFDSFDPNGYRRNVDPELNAEATDALVVWLASQTKTRSGMWRDIAVRRRPTEVPALYGPVLELAEKHGLETPLIDELIALIRQVEEGRTGMSEDHLFQLDRIARASV